jgi:hypothetical protein
VGVVHHADDGLVLARGGEESQDPQADQEPVLRRAVGDPRGDPQGLLMTFRQGGEVLAQQRDRQSLHGGERDRRLDLVTVRPQHPHPGWATGGGIEQPGLADPRRAGDQQRSSATVARLAQQCVDLPLLRVTAEQAAGAHHALTLGR